MDLIGPIIEVIKFIGRPATNYLQYHRKFNEYVDGLEQARADLQDRKADIQNKLQEELHLGKMPRREVESWLKKVDDKLVDAQYVVDNVSKGKCLFLSCLGKLVDQTTQAMKEVNNEGQFSGSLVVSDPSIIAAELPTSELTGETNVTEEIYKYLIGDEVRMIGVCGMGGIGKTTVMKNVHNRLLKETKFIKLIWATVSQDFDVRRLQNKIASQLNGELSDGEDTIIRAAKLSAMLREQGPYVLILDDVWSSFSLEDAGILEPTTNNGCKLVLTTRSEEIVRSMGCKKVQVPGLSMDKAMQLFSSKVGQDILLLNPTLETIMKDVVYECDGLPLAIVTVAGCMRGISNPFLWKNALNELTGHIKRSLRDMEDKVFGCLKFSYDRLEQNDKDCFLYCALYPEDYEIEKEELVEYWMEEGLIDEMGTRQAMQDSGHSILWKLEENFLLERVEEGIVKMHDVVRDMALDITRKRFLVKAGKQLEGFPDKGERGEDLEKVSLMSNWISKFPQNMLSPKCQKLTTLLLSNNSLEEIPESFFDYIPNLKILDLSKNEDLLKLPNSISNLEKLTALLLDYCGRLESVPSLSKLQALKKLNLEGTSIKEIPQGLEMLVNLRYLNLRFTSELKEIPDGILSKVNDLQHLILHPAFSRAEEIKQLSKLEAFEVCITVDDYSSMYAYQRKGINQYSILVCGEVVSINGFCTLRSGGDYGKIVSFKGLKLETENPIILLPSDIQLLNISQLCVSEGGRSSLNNIFELKDVIELKQCSIDSCFGLDYIFSSWFASLQTLEVLRLSVLWNLKAIVGKSVPPTRGTFSSLKVISLFGCQNLKIVLSPKWDLHNLKEIAVRRCVEIKEIIALEEEKEGMGTHDKVKITFPKLRKLTLEHLPKLKSICQPNETIVCDSLQQLEIKNCPELKRIPLYFPLLEVDNSQPTPPLAPNGIFVHPKEWWESVEWDHPNAKNVLSPLLKFWDESISRWKQAI